MKKMLSLFFILCVLCCVVLPMHGQAATVTLYWPVPGHFSLTQNYHSGHKAIDISDSTIAGAAIVSVCDGTIVRVHSCSKNHAGSYDCSCGGAGNGIVVKGADNRYYTYAHMKAGSTSGYVANKTKVTAGQTIGYVGNTGNSYGAHLHFVISKDTAFNTCYDPEKETYINTGVANPFTFAKDNSKMSVSNTNAVIAVKLTKPLENRLIKYGAAVYSENGVKLGSVWENASLTDDTKTVTLYWDIASSMGLTLKPGTKYYFDFWATVSGVTLTSSRYAFTTTGTPSYTVDCYDNYSGKNYFVDSDFQNGLNTTRYTSRDSAVYKLSVDTSVKHDSRYNTLKIVGTAAGATSKDLSFSLITNASRDHQHYVGDSSNMTLSFWAKSSVDGAKMYIRWGYQSENIKSVTLTNQWQYYTVAMPREMVNGNNLHPYFDKAGTFWLSELQMEDGNTATAFVPERGNKTSIEVTYGKTYNGLPTPTREGYTFLGWYTNAVGGTQIKATDTVKKGNLALYAHWKKNQSVSKQGWQFENAKWYYYKNNVKQTGWIKDSGYWYYMNKDGVMQTGWLKQGSVWYYLRSGGNMATGWVKVGSVYYYMNKDGVMQTGWVRDGGVWYYMNSSGAMVIGWQKIGSTWYYFKSSGAMQTGWLKQGGTWYYFNASGAMATGSVKIGTKTYNFASSGACLNP